MHAVDKVVTIVVTEPPPFCSRHAMYGLYLGVPRFHCIDRCTTDSVTIMFLPCEGDRVNFHVERHCIEDREVSRFLCHDTDARRTPIAYNWTRKL